MKQKKLQRMRILAIFGMWKHITLNGLIKSEKDKQGKDSEADHQITTEHIDFTRKANLEARSK